MRVRCLKQQHNVHITTVAALNYQDSRGFNTYSDMTKNCEEMSIEMNGFIKCK